jgi:uncharacterized membrane protein YozB (DUF420 family)
MVPSFVEALIPITLKNPTDLIALISTVHVAFGIAATILGVWILGTWRLRQSMKFCTPKKKAMRYTFIVWLVSAVLGILFYFVLNWNALF